MVFLIAGITAIGAGIGALLPAGALTAVGFTTAGVAAGSAAATIQGVVYAGATTGAFAAAQR